MTVNVESPLMAKASRQLRPSKPQGTRAAKLEGPASSATAERAAQLALGRCNMARLPQLATRPFRAELTIEENSLFVGNGYKGDFFVRETIVPLSGEEIIQRLTVGKTHGADRARGVLRQIHQDALYKVLELWGQQGHPVGEIRGKIYGLIRTSVYELVGLLFPGDDSARVYRRTRELLTDLQAIPIVLENVYTYQGLRDREQFTLLAEVTWSERKLDSFGKPSLQGKSEATIMLSSLVTEGFLARHIKVLLGQPYDELRGRGRRSEIARLLYPFLDLQLAEHDAFEAPLDTLSERFGLQRYLHRSKRKEKFGPALRALHGKPIREGRFKLSMQLVETKNDYVLRAERVPVVRGHGAG